MAMDKQDRGNSAMAPSETGGSMRRNFYVKPVDAGLWEAISSLEAQRFPTEEAALRWARAAARREWEKTGQPWGVRVRGEQGGWTYDTCLGRADDDPDPAIDARA
jgi:hypothetical protein